VYSDNLNIQILVKIGLKRDWKFYKLLNKLKLKMAQQKKDHHGRNWFITENNP